MASAAQKPLVCSAFADAASVPEKLMGGLVEAYIEVFREPPWEEQWTPLKVWEKLRAEVCGPHSHLTILHTENDATVAGFSWGTVVDRVDVAGRMQAVRR